MKRTQVQIPDPLYNRARRVAQDRDWSVSEVFRRALEQYIAECSLAERPPVEMMLWLLSLCW